MTIIIKGQGDDSLIYIDAYEKDNIENCTRVHHLKFSPIETYSDINNTTADYRCVMPELYDNVRLNKLTTDVIENMHELGGQMRFSVYSTDDNGSINSSITDALITKDGVIINGTDNNNNVFSFDLNAQKKGMAITFQRKDSSPYCFNLYDSDSQGGSLLFDTGLDKPDSVQFSYNAKALSATTNKIMLSGVTNTIEYSPSHITIDNMDSGLGTLIPTGVFIHPGSSNTSVIFPFNKRSYSIDRYYGCSVYDTLDVSYKYSGSVQEISNSLKRLYDTWNKCEFIAEYTISAHFIMQTITITGLFDSNDNVIQPDKIVKFVRQGYYIDDIRDALLEKAKAYTQDSDTVYIDNIAWSELKLIRYIL